MDENLGPGGHELGGMTARVVQGGVMRRGDEVVVLAGESAPVEERADSIAGGVAGVGLMSSGESWWRRMMPLDTSAGGT